MRYLSLALAALSLPPMSYAQGLTALGKTSCEWGARDCNQCVSQLERQFQSFSQRADRPQAPSGRFKYWSGAHRAIAGLGKPMLPLSQDDVPGWRVVNDDHIQGFGRLGAIGDNLWLAATVAVNDRDHQLSGVMVIRMGSLAISGSDRTRGYRLSSPRSPDQFFYDAPDEADEVNFFLPLFDFDNANDNPRHPSGFQALGQLLLIPSYEAADSMLTVLEMRETLDSSVVLPTIVNQVSVPDRGGKIFGNSTRFPFTLAAVKLENDRHLLLMRTSNNGHVQILLSDQTEINNETTWTKIQNSDTAFKKYESTSFMTDCESGEIYLAGIKADDPSDKWGPGISTRADLYRVNVASSGDKYEFSERLSRAYFSQADDSCEGGGGSSFYVTRGGQMIFYCSQGRSVEAGRTDQDPYQLRFSEFYPSFIVECQDELFAGQCDAGDILEEHGDTGIVIP